MPSGRQQLPASWAAYERGGRDHSSDSGLSHNRIHFDDDGPDNQPAAHHDHLRPSAAANDVQDRTHDMRHRRSSMGMRINSLRQAGGVNSVDNFARSWQRAAGFYEITPARRSFMYADEDNADPQYQRNEVTGTSGQDQLSLLRKALTEEGTRKGTDDAVEDGEPVGSSQAGSSGDDTVRGERQPLLQERIARARDDSIFSIEPSLGSVFGGSYGTAYGSLASRVNEPSMRHAGRLFRQQQMSGVTEPDKEREPLLVKRIEEDDGKVVSVVVGQSTLPQTIFNAVNVLIGIGLLALPLALKYSGWVPGLIFLTFAAAITSYTAKLLAKCLDVDSSLVTFADLAYVSFGPGARIATSILFSLELLATCVALVVLFADSLDALIPGWGLTEWKIVCGIILIPLAFLPLRLLSFTSVLGIICCFSIVFAVFIDGLIKPHQPGSLISPAPTHLFPSNWLTLPLSFGLLMSPWGGHSVFPNIYRDMRHPHKYRKSVDITYSFTFLLDMFMAVVGLLMFGDGIKDEVTRNILESKEGYPEWLSVFIVICVAIIPLTKVPLNARPIVSTLELFLGLDARAMSPNQTLNGLSGFTRGILKTTVRIGCTVLFVILAILFPQFDTIMSLLGAVACFTICIILPLAFHLKLFGDQLSRWEKFRDWTMIVVSTVLAVVATAVNFVPREKLGLQ
ncbi:hypothetical protein MBLNU230_g2155t1 [Neophaeotheca triangularis]